MITLENDGLTFSFPEIEEQIRTLVEAHVESTVRILHQSLNPDQLLEALCDHLNSPRSEWELRSTHPDEPDSLHATDGPRLPRPRGATRFYVTERDNLLATAASLTEADMKSAMHEAIQEECPKSDVPAEITFRFQRTLRIPDDGTTYPLPAGLGSFPLRSVDDHADTAPEEWRKRGGVMMPMYQSEALWIGLSTRYPFAVKIAAGKINAVSGEPWTGNLQDNPQNYVVAPDQPWLDGFSVGEGLIRQFVAMPLGAGCSVEEQLTGKADIGGIQIQAYPMRADPYFERHIASSLPTTIEELLPRLFAKHLVPARRRFGSVHPAKPHGMGLGAGGMMRQEIYEDRYGLAAWDRSQTKRCFVHLCNSMDWRQITGANPPHPPLTAEEYKSAGIPWFDYYRDDQKPLKGSKQLAEVKSVASLGKKLKNLLFDEDTSITPETIIQYGNTRRPEEIREFLDTP